MKFQSAESVQLDGQFESLNNSKNFSSNRQSILETVTNFLNHHLSRIQDLCHQGTSGRLVVEDLTAVFDRLMKNLYRLSSDDLNAQEVAGCALIAIGGYGRGEMNPRSDLDLMFYYEAQGKDAAKAISDRMLYLLWDLNLDVGYSVRSAADCLSEAKDSTVRTALLDARLIAGSPVVFEAFSQSVGKIILNQNTQAFIELKLEENETRKKNTVPRFTCSSPI